METKVFLPNGLLIWLEGKMLINQHFLISILPTPISKSASYPRPYEAVKH